MHAMLLCAGLGTRLRPLTLERPKPLVPVLGRPLASYALDRLAAAGVRHVVMNSHHLGEQLVPALTGDARRLGLDIEAVHEPTLLGTAGGIRNALPRLGVEPFLVFNGDVLAAPDIGSARALHDRSGAWLTLVLREDPRAEQLGPIDVDASGRVVRMLNEGPEPRVPYRRCLFTGIYVVSPAIREDLPDQGCMVRDTLRRLLARGATVAGWVDAGPWHDLGTVGSYADANFGLLGGRIAFPGVAPAASGSWLDATVRVGEGVKVGREVVVGAGADAARRGDDREGDRVGRR